MGEVGWKQLTIGDVLAHRKERASGKEPLLSVTRENGVIPQSEVGRRDSSSEDKQSYWRVHPGDIVYNTMRMWQGVSGRSDMSGIVSPAYTVCAPKEGADSRFIARLLAHKSLIHEFYRNSQGLTSDTWNLKYSSFARISIKVPPSKTEQRRVSDIFDSIDSQIFETERILSKTSSTHIAFQNSLVNSLKTSSSLLGKHLAAEPQNGYSPKEIDEWTGVCSLGLGCLTHYGFIASQLKNVPSGNPRNSAAMLRDGDLLMSRANTRELVGLVGIYRDIGEPCIYPDLMMRLKVNSNCRTEFMEIVLRSDAVRRQIQSMSQGTSESMVKINSSSVKNLQVRIPDLSEQDRILGILNESGSRTRKVKQEYAKLKLLKQALMDDLLTGRVRVPIEEYEKQVS